MFRNESSSDRRYTDAPNSGVYHDDRASMRGALIEATFEPAWVEYIPWAPSRGVKRQAEEEPRQQVYYQGRERANANHFLGASAETTGASRDFGSGVSGTRPVSTVQLSTADEVSEDLVKDVLAGVIDTVVGEEVLQPVGSAALGSKMPPPQSKKPRRTLGLAVGLGGGGSVVVHNVSGS
jgi:hypothetical protein